MGNIASLCNRAIDVVSHVDTNASILSECVAYTIATAWHQDIRKNMWLGGEFPVHELQFNGFRLPSQSSDTSFTLTETIEFVDFSFSDLNDQVLAHIVPAARAAALVWFALSCCPGFSGTENPTFWWRVFSSAYRSSATSAPPWNEDEWSKLHIVADRAFFSHPDRPFPRIRVRSLQSSWLPLFLFGNDVPQAIERQLTSALRVLEPFISNERWEQDLPAAYCDGSLHWLLEDNANRDTVLQTPTSGAVKPPKRAHKAMRITEVHSVSKKVDNLDKLLATSDVQVRYSTSVEIEHVIGTTCTSIRLDPRLRLQRLHLCGMPIRTNPTRDYDDTIRHFAKWCSALPHTQVIQSVNTVFHAPHLFLNDINAAWLGYAIFHPVAAVNQCSFTNLTLGVTPGDRATVQILASMATGNNLLAAMGLTSSIHTCYRQVKLQSGTSVWSAPSRNTNQAVDGEGEPESIFYTCTAEEWMTVCKVTPDWTQVVLPGHGFGWIRTNDALETVDQPAGRSTVRRLFIETSAVIHSREPTYITASRELVLDILSLLGSELEYLKLRTGKWELTAEDMYCILDKCPNLKTLRVRHDGSCWSKTNLARLPENPQLQELELVIRDSFQPLVAPQLDQLEVFRLTSETGPTNHFETIHHSFFSLLKQYPKLKQLVWKDEGGGWNANRRQSAWMLLWNSFVPGEYDYAQAPFGLRLRLAFLSVICTRNYATNKPMDALAQLGPDLVDHIISFCSSVVPRTFHINLREIPRLVFFEPLRERRV